MVNNDINTLHKNLKQELINNWNEISEEKRKDITFSLVASNYCNKNFDLQTKIQDLEQEKYELKKTLLAELAGGVHETYDKLIKEKETEIEKEIKERKEFASALDKLFGEKEKLEKRK